ncbi:MAG: hypothetical protein GC150_12495 [Rhizobiales bacterium]|nr:hypothetical protein [Hyphomicrobiales bacterium]
MLRLKGLLDSWTYYYVLLGVLAGGLVHVLAILTLPHIAPARAWQQLGVRYPVNTLQVLARAKPGEMALPLMSPDVHYAVCQFDVTKGAVTFSTEMLEGSWSIAIYNRLGLNSYTIGGTDLQHQKISLVLTRSQAETTSAPVAEGAMASTLTVPLTEPKGIVILRAPVKGPAYEALTTEALSRARCEETEE